MINIILHEIDAPNWYTTSTHSAYKALCDRTQYYLPWLVSSRDFRFGSPAGVWASKMRGCRFHIDGEHCPVTFVTPKVLLAWLDQQQCGWLVTVTSRIPMAGFVCV